MTDFVVQSGVPGESIVWGGLVDLVRPTFPPTSPPFPILPMDASLALLPSGAQPGNPSAALTNPEPRYWSPDTISNVPLPGGRPFFAAEYVINLTDTSGFEPLLRSSDPFDVSAPYLGVSWAGPTAQWGQPVTVSGVGYQIPGYGEAVFWLIGAYATQLPMPPQGTWNMLAVDVPLPGKPPAGGPSAMPPGWRIETVAAADGTICGSRSFLVQ